MGQDPGPPFLGYFAVQTKHTVLKPFLNPLQWGISLPDPFQKHFMINSLLPVYFEADNKTFRAATKLARGASLDSARVLAAAHCRVGVRAPM